MYRARFEAQNRPEAEDKPRFMMAVNVIAADTDARAQYLQSSQQLAFARLRSGQPGKLPAPTDDLSEISSPQSRQIDQALRISAVGSPATIRTGLTELISTYQPDELILTGQIHDPQAREHSFRLAAEVLDGMSAT